MKAIIIGQNHSITTYQVNGKKRYIIEDIPQTSNRRIVNDAIRGCGSRAWADVTNEIDKHYNIDSGIERAIDRMTY